MRDVLSFCYLMTVSGVGVVIMHSIVNLHVVKKPCSTLLLELHNSAMDKHIQLSAKNFVELVNYVTVDSLYCVHCTRGYLLSLQMINKV